MGASTGYGRELPEIDFAQDILIKSETLQNENSIGCLNLGEVELFEMWDSRQFQKLNHLLDSTNSNCHLVVIAVQGITAAQLLEILPLGAFVRHLSIRFYHHKANYECLKTLANAQSLGNLFSLDLTGNKIDNYGAVIITKASALAGLTHLNLGNNNISDYGAMELAGAVILQNLTSLNLSRNNIGPEAVVAIALSPIFKGLTSLSLSNNPIEPSGAHALACLSTFSGLRVLDLSYCQIGGSGVSALTDEESNLKQLTHLNLVSNLLGPRDARAIAESTNLASLLSLHMGMNCIGDFGAMALAQSRTLTRLVSLTMGANHIGDAAKKALYCRFPFMLEKTF